jgi:hypothetical protein
MLPREEIILFTYNPVPRESFNFGFYRFSVIQITVESI